MQMTMTDAEVQALLADKTQPNRPMALAGQATGSLDSAPVTTEAARERREAMSQALARGVSPDRIIQTFSKKYGMGTAGVRTLMKEVRAMWDEEDAETMRYAKAAARRRILPVIAKATAEKRYAAVANLEKVLADVEGTALPEEEINQGVDARLTDAVIAVLGSEDEKTVRLMIEKERMYVEISTHDGTESAPSQRIVIDAPVAKELPSKGHENG